MTFPTAVKKSGPATISKTRSKVLVPGSPRSPGSPINAPANMISSGSTAKTLLTSKTAIVGSTGSVVKKLSVAPKSPTSPTVVKSLINAKQDLTKTATFTVAKGEIKSITKPPPLTLNIKSSEAKGLQSPTTPTKSVPKTPTSSSVKSLVVTKSPLATKSTLTSKSVSSSVIKSISGTKSTTSPIKSLVSVPSKPNAVSRSSTATSITPKSPSKPTTPISKTMKSKTVTKESPILVKPISTKDLKSIVKPTSPIKKTAVSPTKSVTGVKPPTIPITKSTVIPRSPSTASSIKSISLKTSPSKSLNKESSNGNTSSIKLEATNKIGVSKLESASPKISKKKESSSLSPLSIKSTSTIKSTSSSMSKTPNSNPKVCPPLVTKSVLPKSPITKTKTPLSSVVKTSSTVKTPSSPTTKTSSLSLVKPPLSPITKKMVPTKLILSPGPSKNNSLMGSRLSFVSTESLASRTSLKSPLSPKISKIAPKSPGKVVKKTETIQPKGIRGGQPIKKSIEITGITELSPLVLNDQESLNIKEFCSENVVENILNEKIEFGVAFKPKQSSISSDELITQKTCINVDNLEVTNNFVEEELINMTKIVQNVNESSKIQENNLEIMEDNFKNLSPFTLLEKQKEDEDLCNSLNFVVVKANECEPHSTSISQTASIRDDIKFDDNHFNLSNENVVLEHHEEAQSCIIYVEDHFEPMNDKLVLGDVPFETDSSQSDVSDNEQTLQTEINENSNCNAMQTNSEDVFSFSEELAINDFTRADSTESFIHQFMPKSTEQFKGASSISTDDGSLLSRKSYSEVVSGSPKDSEYYFDFDFEIVDNSLEDDEDEKSVFVEVTEKEFPELKPKDLSNKRKKNKKQKKRNHSKTESQSDKSVISTPEVNYYNPEEFDSNEFCRYLKMIKDCSFYPNGLFSSDSVKLSTSFSWLDISVRTTDDDLTPSVEFLNTYEVFQASNLSKDFLTSIIGSTPSTPTNDTWFWKSIEGKHQMHNKANITLSLQPKPKHLTTPRFMTLLALISEAKCYQIEPSLSENFVTTDCMPRFDDKIRRLMVEGFWLIGRLINESLSDDEDVNCGNPFNFADGDIGLWWAGINMLDWQEYMKECGKNQTPPSCYQFVVENMDGRRHNSSEAVLSMNAIPDDFMSELDVENFIHTVRNVKYYCGHCFVDSQENFEESLVESCDTSSVLEWENNSNGIPEKMN